MHSDKWEMIETPFGASREARYLSKLQCVLAFRHAFYHFTRPNYSRVPSSYGVHKKITRFPDILCDLRQILVLKCHGRDGMATVGSRAKCQHLEGTAQINSKDNGGPTVLWRQVTIQVSAEQGKYPISMPLPFIDFDTNEYWNRDNYTQSGYPYNTQSSTLPDDKVVPVSVRPNSVDCYLEYV